MSGDRGTSGDPGVSAGHGVRGGPGDKSAQGRRHKNDMGRLTGFEAFVADQAQPLARTALLLTGDPHAARTFVIGTLTRIAARWPTLRWARPADTARQGLFTYFLARPADARAGDTRAGDTRATGRKGRAGAARGELRPSTVPATERSSLQEALAALSTLQRALIVARFHEGMPEPQAAGLCRTAAVTARAEIELALAELRHRVPGLAAPVSGAARASADLAAPTSAAAPPPWTPPGPETDTSSLPSATSWASPTPEPEIIAFAKEPAWAPVPPSAVPWGGSTAGASGVSGPVRADPMEEALRRGLDAIASEMPPVRVVDEVVDTARRRRASRVSLIASVCVTLAAVMIVPIVFGMTVFVGAIRDSADRGVPDGPADDPYGIHEDGPADGPAQESGGPLPSVVDAPIRYAYLDSCTPGQASGNDCVEWRVVTAKGQEYEIVDVGVEDSSRANELLAVSGDGNQIAYYSSSASDFVIVDRRHSVPEATELVPYGQTPTNHTSLAISPTGRWLAAGLGTRKAIGRPRVHDATTKRTWTLPLRMRVLAVSDGGTVLGTTVTRVNDTRITELVRMRPNGRVLSRVSLRDPMYGLRLPVAGMPLSPDGRGLALIDLSDHPGKDSPLWLSTVDPGTGRVRTSCAPRLSEDAEVLSVRGWASAREVIVDARTASDGGSGGGGAVPSVHAVDVRSCAARDIVLDERSRVPPVWTPGVLG
ncbi:hypothetical protein [Microtetraspora glauca]|uniref:RNA polymerase sigma factor 70 region 4 type 2 domain-containing protein n=1 Tax=Microtetraspora glauca TaxID=1996 RepID=A0ABV3G6T5_MICGL